MSDFFLGSTEELRKEGKTFSGGCKNLQLGCVGGEKHPAAAAAALLGERRDARLLKELPFGWREKRRGFYPDWERERDAYRSSSSAA